MSVEVTSEPLTYRPDSRVSYFKDLVERERGDYAATERIRRHEQEIRDELADRETRQSKPGDVEYRTSPNRTTGVGGNFAPPLWLIDQFATAPRPGRVLADLMPQFPLPEGVQSVNLPRLTTGTAQQAINDLAADPAVDAVDSSVTCEVVTISGHGDASLQLLDQSPPGAHLDWAFFKDLSEAYDANLETQLINGATAQGQLPGLLGLVPSANQVVYTDSTPTATEMFPFLGQMVAHIGNNRKLPPEAWLMTTSRLGWLGSSEDLQTRPLMLADRDANGDFDLLTFLVKVDDAIPTSLGAAGNQDTIIACRPSDGILLESTPRASVHLEVLSGTLQARIQLHRYVAALQRYPSGISSLTGTGLVVQSGFST